MAIPPRLMLALVVLLVSAQCRCQYEVVLFEPSDGGMEADIETGTPVTFTLGGETKTAFAGATIGTEFDEDCPDGQVLRGFQGYIQGNDAFNLVTGVQGLCGTIATDGASSVNVTATASLPFHGTMGDVGFDLSCPANQVAVGFYGRAGTALDQLAVYCAPVTLVDGVLTVGTVTALPPQGGNPNNGWPYDASCPAGQVVRGQFGSYDVYVQSLGLACATPSAL